MPEVGPGSSSSYAKILGETKFQPREFPQSGSKAKAKDRKERQKFGNNKGRLQIAKATSGGARKSPGPKQSALPAQHSLATACFKYLLH